VAPLQIIRQEARAHRTVLIDGRERDGTRESREVEPYSLRPGKTDTRLMFWCLKRNGMRSLLVRNILSAQPTGHTFAPRYPIEL
jgi:predicted DNA-binding transcriptional regulator YafY